MRRELCREIVRKEIMIITKGVENGECIGTITRQLVS